MPLHDGERVVFSNGELRAPVDDRTKREHLTRYRLVKDRLVQGSTVLDLGCGVGYGAAILQDRCGRIYAIDSDEEAIAYARWHFSGWQIQYQIGDLETMPLPKADAVVAFELLEHLKDPAAMLDRIAEVLPPRGLLAVSSPIRPTKAENPWHRWDWTAAEFEALFERHFVIDERLLQNRSILVLIAHRRATLEPLPGYRSEAAKCRARLAQFCGGVGVDLGFGGDLLVPQATGIDRRSFPDVPGAMAGDVMGCDVVDHFPEATLDFVASVHFLEHVADPIRVLTAWTTRLRPGGHLVLNLPHRLLYREYNPEHVWNPDPELAKRWCDEAAARADRVPTVVHEFIDSRPDCYSFDLVVRMDVTE